MQTHGYIINNDQKILILVRDSKTCRYVKLRKSGADGNHFTEEEVFLNSSEQAERLEELLLGNTITC